MDTLFIFISNLPIEFSTTRKFYNIYWKISKKHSFTHNMVVHSDKTNEFIKRIKDSIIFTKQIIFVDSISKDIFTKIFFNSNKLYLTKYIKITCLFDEYIKQCNMIHRPKINDPIIILQFIHSQVFNKYLQIQIKNATNYMEKVYIGLDV